MLKINTITNNRLIDYLRISVTDRCNFRCLYCMPNGIKLKKHAEILSYEEILTLIDIFTLYGIKKIRLTGGEPLLRPNLTTLIQRIAQNPKITDLSLTTNGSLLYQYASELKTAGLKRINISLPATTKESFYNLTKKNAFNKTLQGIEKAIALNFQSVKINVILTDFLNEQSLDFLTALAKNNNIQIRFIEYMPLNNNINQQMLVSNINTKWVKNSLEKYGGKLQLITNHQYGNGPAKYYKLEKSKGIFGFITPITEHFCHNCNRLRLTADGKLKPCLLSNQEFDLKTPLRNTTDKTVLLKIISETIKSKPLHYDLSKNKASFSLKRKMSQIGG